MPTNANPLVAALAASLMGGSNGPLGARGMLEYGNIDPFNRPIVANPNGGLSTLLSSSYGFDNGEVLLPTVADDRATRKKGEPQGHFMSHKETINRYLRGPHKGESLGVFDTPDNATRYGKFLHERGQQKMSDLLMMLLMRGL